MDSFEDATREPHQYIIVKPLTKLSSRTTDSDLEYQPLCDQQFTQLKTVSDHVRKNKKKGTFTERSFLRFSFDFV